MAFGVQRDPISGAVRYNAAAAGAKRYGPNGSLTATQGTVDHAGYDEREMRRKARRAAIERRAKMGSTSAIPTPLGGGTF